MRSLLLLVLLALLVPDFSQAYLVKDKEAAELAYRMRTSPESQELGKQVEKAYEQERLNELANHRPKVNLTDEDRARLELEYKLAQTPPTYVENKKGFTTINDEVELRICFAMIGVKDIPPYAPNTFYKVELDRGEMCRVTIVGGDRRVIAVLIPKNVSEYLLEAEAWRDGKLITEETAVPQEAFAVECPVGVRIILKFSRAPALLK